MTRRMYLVHQFHLLMKEMEQVRIELQRQRYEPEEGGDVLMSQRKTDTVKGENTRGWNLNEGRKDKLERLNIQEWRRRHCCGRYETSRRIFYLRRKGS